MPKLSEVSKTPSISISNNPLSELMLFEGAAEMIKLFTDETTEISLHFEADETLRGYFNCQGNGCFYCLANKKPSKFFLLPVFSIDRNTVSVMRISPIGGPYRLLPQLTCYAGKPDLADKVLLVKRLDRYRFSVEERNSESYRTIGTEAVSLFLKQVETGVFRLTDIFPSYSDEELRSVPHIRRQLNILEGIDVNDGLE